MGTPAIHNNQHNSSCLTGGPRSPGAPTEPGSPPTPLAPGTPGLPDGPGGPEMPFRPALVTPPSQAQSPASPGKQSTLQTEFHLDKDPFHLQDFQKQYLIQLRQSHSHMI